MVYIEQELLPMDQIKSSLHSLSADNQSADCCLFIEEKHAAVTAPSWRLITGFRYRASRGYDALKLIKGIGIARIKLQKSQSSTNQPDTTYITSITEKFKSS
jgi:hypothetical protein